MVLHLVVLASFVTPLRRTAAALFLSALPVLRISHRLNLLRVHAARVE